MTHLTVDEILDFVTMTEFNQASLELASYVNTHITKCPKCFKAVSAFQTIYDEFSVIYDSPDKQQYLDYLKVQIDLTDKQIEKEELLTIRAELRK